MRESFSSGGMVESQVWRAERIGLMGVGLGLL